MCQNRGGGTLGFTDGEFVRFAEGTGGKLSSFIVNLTATVSYAKDPRCAVAVTLQVSSVISRQRFQMPTLSPGAGEKKASRYASDTYLTVQRLVGSKIIAPHVSHTLDNDA